MKKFQYLLIDQIEPSSFCPSRVLHTILHQFFIQSCFLTFSMRNLSIYRGKRDGYMDEDDPTKSEKSVG
jgi:hypothetical protein